MVKVNWVDHRTFGLSLQVYGSISHHVMNIMRVAIMEAQFTKHTRGLLLKGECEKFILNYKLAVSSFSASISMYRSQKNNISKSNNSRLLSYGVLQDPQLIPSEIAASLAEKKIGFRLDNADLVRFILSPY